MYADESCINVIQIQIQKLYLIGTCVVRQVFQLRYLQKSKTNFSFLLFYLIQVQCHFRLVGYCLLKTYAVTDLFHYLYQVYDTFDTVCPFPPYLLFIS